MNSSRSKVCRLCLPILFRVLINVIVTCSDCVNCILPLHRSRHHSQLTLCTQMVQLRAYPHTSHLLAAHCSRHDTTPHSLIVLYPIALPLQACHTPSHPTLLLLPPHSSFLPLISRPTILLYKTILPNHFTPQSHSSDHSVKPFCQTILPNHFLNPQSMVTQLPAPLLQTSPPSRLKPRTL